MTEREAWTVWACLLGLALCVLLQDLQSMRLRRDVEFATVLAEKRMTDV